MKPMVIGLLVFAAVTAVALVAGSQSRRNDGSEFASRALAWEDLAELLERKDSGVRVVDVRTPEEFASGAIPGAINIPYTELAENLPAEDRSARIVVYCRSGSRSAMAKTILAELGFTDVNDFGGVYRWKGELIRRP